MNYESDEEKLAKFFKKPKVRLMLIIFAFFFGLFMSAFLIFQVMFLYRVLPHGGL